MKRTWITLGFAVTALAVAGAAAADSDESATAEISYGCAPTGECAPEPFLVMQGVRARETVSVDLDVSAGRFVVEDSEGIVPAQPEPSFCLVERATVVSCDHIGRNVHLHLKRGDDEVQVGSRLEKRAWIDGDAGDDVLRVQAAAEVQGWLFGEQGNDRLIGAGSSERRDWLAGGYGRDMLRGRAERDLIFGGPDADSAYGGPGSDRLMMADRTGSDPAPDPDRIIDCGPGRDIAFVNPRVDPPPIHCERVNPKNVSPPFSRTR